jgi:hypothetical protein
VTDILVGTRGGLRGPGGESDPTGEPIVALASVADVRWALVGGDVLRSDDGRWDRVATIDEYRGRCIVPTDDGLLVGTSEAHLFRIRRGAAELVESFEEVSGRDDWYTPWGGPPDTRSMSVDAAGTVYVNVHVGGVVRSRDGATWEPTIDVDADVHQVMAHPTAPGTVLAACAGGLAVSTDGGDSWDITADGLHAPYSRAVAVAGETILLTASTGPFTDQAAVYRRSLGGGEPFERCTGGLPEWFPSNIDSHCLAARGSVAAFGTDRGEVWVSEDEGRTWELASSDHPAVTCVLVE